MTFDLNQINRKSFIYKLTIWEQDKFTGSLTVRTLSGVEWRLYLCLGRLIWVTGGNHVARQLYRHLLKNNLKLDRVLGELNFRERNFEYGWDYHAIDTLVEKKQLSRDRAQNIIQEIILENLFDILQYESRELLLYEEEKSDLEHSTLKFIKLFNLKELLFNVLENWKIWQKSQLDFIFLESAPILTEKIKVKASCKTYQSLRKLLNGKRTLREVARLTQKNEIQVARSLIPYLETGMIQLVKLPDFPSPGQKKKTPKDAIAHPKTQKIICVDDSLQAVNLMKGIIQDAGYEFIGLRDPVRALGILIECQPDLIFLDLVMPVINGYELCRQIRRVSTLKNVPVIILTSGIIEGWRARTIGASALTKKPIEKQKILKAIEKYLKSNNSGQDAVKSPEQYSQPTPHESIVAV